MRRTYRLIASVIVPIVIQGSLVIISEEYRRFSRGGLSSWWLLFSAACGFPFVWAEVGRRELSLMIGGLYFTVMIVRDAFLSMLIVMGYYGGPQSSLHRKPIETYKA